MLHFHFSSKLLPLLSYIGFMKMKTAREAWKVIKSVDSIVTLFHCVLRHQLRQKSVSLETHTGRDYIVDTMLEFDDAMNELLSIFPESSGVDDILAAFPRLSNSCIENEADGGGLLLLALQERWVAMMFRSKTLQQCLKEKTAIDPPGGHSVFEVLRAYIQNFEHVIPMQKDHQKVVRHCEALVRILDGALKLLRKVRERKQHKLSGRRKKRKESPDNGVDFVLVWDDQATQKLLGDRADCIW